MKWSVRNFPWKWIRIVAGLVLLAFIGISYSLWWPPLSAWIDATLASQRAQSAGGEEGQAEEAGAAETGHSAAASLELTSQALNNLGLTPEFLRPIELSTYRRAINVPAVVMARPGRTQLQVSSPLNGVITHVHAVTGEAVLPGELLFEIRLSYEDLVESQTAFLKSLGELEVENREIVRLEGVAQSGAVSGKSLLERRYAKDKLEALIRSQREGLKLHGLSDRQVDVIANEGKLLRDLQIVAPAIDKHSDKEEMRLSRNPIRPAAFLDHQDPSPPLDPSAKPLIIEDLQVQKGQAVVAGEKLCSLSDFSQLFIEGQAFEQDGAAVGRTAEKGWAVDAAFPDADGEQLIRGLKLAFVGNSIDRTARTLSFYVDLPNEMLRDESNPEGQRFISWRYRPGQRLQVRVPVEEWEEQIVLPVDAVVKEGADWFVFQQNGNHFDRVPVHIRYRDQSNAVVANDGSVYPGDVVALKSAHQMQMAIKNKSGGKADPHAGHNH